MKKTKTAKLFKTVFIATLIASFTFVQLPIPSANAEAYVKPGYNGKIVYSTAVHGDYEIYTMNADGTNNTRITTWADDDDYPSWSPDGTKILYTSARSSTRDIYQMDADGSNEVNLTNTGFYHQHVQWSPDGQKILYTYGSGSSYTIATMNPDGSGQTLLASVTTWSTPRPQWSEDGSRIVYENEIAGNTEVFLMNSDGGNKTQLTTASGTDGKPTWASSDSKILFTSTRDGNTEIYVMDANGSNQTRLTNTPSNHEQFPKLSPDGEWFASAGAPGSNFYRGLLVSRIDGSEQYVVDLAEEGQDVMSATSWSPDGKKVLVTGNWSEQNIYAISVPSGAVEQLTTDGASGIGEAASWHSVLNSPPVATPDALTVPFQIAGTSDVLANDTDEEALSGDNLSITVQPTNGSASVLGGKIRYAPNSGFQGADSITYEICDSFTLDQLCATGMLNVTVQAPTAPALTVLKVNGESYGSETNSYATSNPRPTFSGTASPGAEIRVEIHSDPIVLTTTADGSGNWSVAPTFNLPSGEHMVYISATLYGLTTELDSFRLTIQPSLADTGESLGWMIMLPTTALLLGGALLLTTRLKNPSLR